MKIEFKGYFQLVSLIVGLYLLVNVLSGQSVLASEELKAMVKNSKKEAELTKKKINSNAGLFEQLNYRGTMIRPAKPEDSERAPASVEESNESE